MARASRRSEAPTPVDGDGKGACAYLVRGDDPALVAQRVHDLVGELAGGREPTLVVEEHGVAGSDAPEVDAVVDALTTPPFLSDLRVVVVREAGRIGAADAARLSARLQQPVDGVVLVLVAGGGTVPAALVKAVERAGQVVDTTLRAGRERSQWLNEQLRSAPMRFDARAVAALDDHLGEDVARLRGLLDTLAAAYGEHAAIDEGRLAPFLGEAGTVAPWDLTDALDAGDTPGALDALRRLLNAGAMHPLAVLAVLHRHYQAMLRLDGSGVTSGDEAASVLQLRSAYPARKAFEQGRRLGSGRIGRAVTLLAEADLDVRGRSALGTEVVLEVLVARLSRLGATRETRPRSSTRRGSARAPSGSRP